MFSFFKKKVVEDIKFFPIKTDMHSHILPGIDDGSPDLETSIFLIKGLMEMGVTKSIATPHVISDLYRNTPTTINAALNSLKNGQKKCPKMKIGKKSWKKNFDETIKKISVRSLK